MAASGCVTRCDVAAAAPPRANNAADERLTTGRSARRVTVSMLQLVMGRTDGVMHR